MNSIDLFEQKFQRFPLWRNYFEGLQHFDNYWLAAVLFQFCLFLVRDNFVIFHSILRNIFKAQNFFTKVLSGKQSKD